MLLTWARAIRALGLGIWLGGIIMAFVVASTVFKVLEKDRTMAGAIVGACLEAGQKVKLGVAIIALAAEAVIFFGGIQGAPIGWRRFVPAAMLLLALATTLVATLWLEPKIHELRKEIADFSEATRDDPKRVEFRKLHGMSMGLLFLEAIFVAAALLTGLL
ncbi:MAG TPA: DUF4149 domain-containing protein [Planctomycetota bacterium]|nr:DUF4149 domain-containing protein [Planctomycetota bacterium]